MYSVTVTVEPAFPVSLDEVFAPWMRGKNDPLIQPGRIGRSIWVSAQQHGIAVLLRAEQLPDSSRSLAQRLMAPIQVQLWAEPSRAGSVALDSLTDELPHWLGNSDDWSDFTKSPAWQLLPAVLHRAHREHPGVRLGANHQLFWQGLAAISEQRVTGIEAMGGLRAVLRKTAPPVAHTGLEDQPPGMLCLPKPQQILSLPSWFWHRAGYDSARSKTIMRFTQRFESLERINRQGSAQQLGRALVSIPGIGPWTIAEILQRTHGHPDTVSVGDYHLAHRVGWVFESRRASDARMLELLEPFRGHRNRVVALIKAAGLAEPRRAPRMKPQDFRNL